MNPRQERFVAEYLVDLNATQAAIRAGYKPIGAAVHASRMLRDPNIAAAIEAGRKAQQKRTEVTADKVLAELARIAFADLTKAIRVEGGSVNVLDTDEVPEELRPAIAEIGQTASQFGLNVRMKLHDKVAALTALAKHFGLLEKPERKPPDTDNVQFEDGPAPS